MDILSSFCKSNPHSAHRSFITVEWEQPLLNTYNSALRSENQVGFLCLFQSMFKCHYVLVFPCTALKNFLLCWWEVENEVTSGLSLRKRESWKKKTNHGLLLEKHVLGNIIPDLWLFSNATLVNNLGAKSQHIIEVIYIKPHLEIIVHCAPSTENSGGILRRNIWFSNW